MITKKANLFSLTYLVIGFSILAVMGMFYGIFIYDIGGEFIITPLTNATLVAGANAGISTNMTNSILAVEQSYYDNEPPWDVFFIFSFIIFFGTSIMASFMSKKESGFGFFSTITIGMIFFLLVFGFVEQAASWLFDNLIVGVLQFDLSSTPFMNAYFANIQVWSFFWVVLIILANQFDLDIFNRQRGSVQP